MMQKGEGGDEYPSGYDVQLILTFTMRPIYPVKTGKVDPDEKLDSRDRLQATVEGGNCNNANGCPTISNSTVSSCCFWKNRPGH